MAQGQHQATGLESHGIQNVARVYWPAIRGKATEVLVYPLGWALFFERDKLIDITQYIPPGS